MAGAYGACASIVKLDSSVLCRTDKYTGESSLVLRFTGGWVRDKLLGVGSHDIDVAINRMTGYQFGLQMKDYLQLPGTPEKYGLTSKAGGLHKIEANPEKSKHLETVTTKIFGLDIDLVNLRKETYTEDSRNPQMEFGTPEEDALRRDATVNAMFYNLGTSEIEDFTGRGFDDMARKIIRTPLDPYQTFKDDPLRVLRLMRFASRLNYTIDEAAKESMKDEDIKEALKVKISRERVGIELEKMLKGPDPRGALAYIDEFGLYGTIFTDPTQKSIECDDDLAKNWQIAAGQLGRLIQGDVEEVKSLGSTLVQNPEEQYLAWVSCALIPHARTQAPPPKKGRPIPYATLVVREGIKAPNKVCDLITASVTNLDEIRQMAQRKSQNLERDTLGMAIRRWGPTWRGQTLFTVLYEICDDPDKTDGMHRPVTSSSKTPTNKEQQLSHSTRGSHGT